MSTATKAASYFFPASSIVSFAASQIYGTGVLGMHSQETLAKIQLKLEGFALSRDVKAVDKIISERIEKEGNKTNLLELKAEWLKHANKVDDLVHTEAVTIAAKSNAWKGENYSYNRFYAFAGGNMDFTGVLSPDMNEMNGLFFADDDFGLKKQFIELEENSVSESLKQFVRSISLAKGTR